MLANCPPLQPLRDDTFGATTIKLVEVSLQYRKCACAAGVMALCEERALLESDER